MQRHLIHIATLILLCIGLVGQTAAQSIEVNFIDAVASQTPEQLQSAIRSYITSNAGYLNTTETRFSLTSFRMDETGLWAELFVIPTSALEIGLDEAEDYNATSILAQQVNPGEWSVVFRDALMDGLSAQAIPPKSFIDLDEPIRPQALTFHYPWTKDHWWFRVGPTQIWHGKTGTSLDFQPTKHRAYNDPAVDLAVLAAESGRLSVSCEDNYQVELQIEHGGGTVTKYLHLQKGSIPRNLLGQQIQRGTYLGYTYTGTAGGGNGLRFNTICGYGDAIHLHFTMPSRNTVLCGKSASAIASETWGAQYKSCNSIIRVTNPPPPSNDPTNLLSNGSFESNLASWMYFPTGQSCPWTTSYNGATHGSKMLSTHRKDSSTCVSLVQDVSVSIQSGETYTAVFSGRRGWDGANRTGRLAIWLGPSTGSQENSANDFVLNGSWHCAQTQIKATRNHSKIRFEIYLDSISHPDYQFDNMRLFRGAVNACAATTITSQPSNQTVTTGENVTFSVGATGELLSYQWQENTGSSWKNISGATATNYTLNNAQLNKNGARYRVVIKGNNGSKTSNVATLTVQEPVVCKEDIDSDGAISILDIQTIAGNIDSGNLTYDVNGDGVLNILDVQAIAGKIGQACPA